MFGDRPLVFLGSWWASNCSNPRAKWNWYRGEKLGPGKMSSWGNLSWQDSKVADLKGVPCELFSRQPNVSTDYCS
uniref:Uncharacterized protein n=1 Tax=Physcomitrium patens TaxID=3218 RepID=A0A2K1KKI1_PHYPA|nr:hypothetical protein PHYPA_007968 [Physcomitrium patens]